MNQSLASRLQLSGAQLEPRAWEMEQKGKDCALTSLENRAHFQPLDDWFVFNPFEQRKHQILASVDKWVFPVVEAFLSWDQEISWLALISILIEIKQLWKGRWQWWCLQACISFQFVSRQLAGCQAWQHRLNAFHLSHRVTGAIVHILYCQHSVNHCQWVYSFPSNSNLIVPVVSSIKRMPVLTQSL